MRRFLCWLALLAAGCTQAEPAGDPHRAFERFIGHLQAAETYVRTSPFYETEQEQAAGYLHLSRSLFKAIEQEMLQDPDFPFFRVLDFHVREGGDNPDQRYLFAPIRGAADYRIWGYRGSADRIEVQLYAGEPWAGTGRSAGFLGMEDIRFNADGTFEVLLSKAQAAGRLLNPADATTVVVRQIYRDWSAENPGDIHIDRVGFEGRAKPAMGVAEVARRLQRTGEVAEQTIRVWPDFVQQRYIDARPANTLAELMDTGRYGGVPGRWMANGYFDIPPGHALLIKTWPTAAKYQGIQLADRWFASLEYANQISSLTTAQAQRAEDGAYYFVIGADDPGYANWLDTGGLRKGVVLLRFDGVQGSIPRELWPHAELVKQERLAALIPGFAKLSVEDRSRQIEARRKHVQTRFHR